MLDLKKNKKFLVVALVSFAAMIWIIAYSLCANSEAYQKALQFSSNNPQISEKLGKILSSRLGIYGFRFSTNNQYGSAEFTLVVTGEKEKADIYFLLSKSSDVWNVQKADLITEGGRENIVAQ